MKNFKLTICEALIERLVNLASLEGNAQFQGVYLEALRESVNARTQLRRSSTTDQNAHTSVTCMSGCCAHNA